MAEGLPIYVRLVIADAGAYRRFDAEEIDFEEYEERKSAILARIKVD